MGKGKQRRTRPAAAAAASPPVLPEALRLPAPDVDPWWTAGPRLPDPHTPQPFAGGSVPPDTFIGALLTLSWGRGMSPVSRLGIAEAVSSQVRPWGRAMAGFAAHVDAYGRRSSAFVEEALRLCVAQIEDLRRHLAALSAAYDQVVAREEETERLFCEVERRLSERDAQVAAILRRLEGFAHDLLLLETAGRLSAVAATGAPSAEGGSAEFPPRSAAELYATAAPLPPSPGPFTPRATLTELEVFNEVSAAQSRAFSIRGTPNGPPFFGGGTPAGAGGVPGPTPLP